MTGFAHSQTTNKIVNEAATRANKGWIARTRSFHRPTFIHPGCHWTIPPGLAGKIVRKPPALGTNQIAGFGGFRPLASLEENN